VFAAQIAKSLERILVEPAQRNHAAEGYVLKTAAAVKSVPPYAFIAVSYGYAGKAGTAGKSLLLNDGKIVRQGYASKTLVQ
jgi:hypothetical protein